MKAHLAVRAFVLSFGVTSAGSAVPAAADGPGAGPAPEATPGGPKEPRTAEPGFFRRLAGDFGRTFTSRDTLCTLGVGGGLTLISVPVDDRIPRSRFNSELYPDTTLDGVFEAGDFAGDAPVLAGSAAAVFFAGTLTGDPRLKGMGSDLMRAQVISGSITVAIKLAVHRERPDGSNLLSFPSGHASAAFATATVFARRHGLKFGAPAYAVAAWIAASRLNENKHFLSDVVFGAAIGIAAGRAVTARGRPAGLIVAPQVVPGGGVGIRFMLIGRT